MKRVLFFCLLILLFSSLSSSSLCARALVSGPVQPTLGPGGSQYAHEKINVWQSGISEEQYWVFEPDSPKPKKPGLVIFLHDWLASDPGYYMAWIRHLCRKGWVVLFPKYQGSGELDKTWFFHVARSAKDFLMQNFKRKSLELDREKFAIIGHGAGAILASNLAAADSYFGLPRIKALFLLMPHQKTLKLYDLSAISRDAKMIIVTGDRMHERNEETAREIFYAADRIKTRNKIYVSVWSDFYGHPPLVADELAPFAPELPEFERLVVRYRYDFLKLAKDRFHAHTIRTSPVDAFDWFVSFRLFDALAQSAFSTQKPELNPLKDSAELRFMGYWSDGRKLKGLIGGDRP